MVITGLRGGLLDEHKRLGRLLPCLQRLAWAQASHRRLATGAGSVSAAYLLSSDLLEMIGSMPTPSHTAWNGQVSTQATRRCVSFPDPFLRYCV